MSLCIITDISDKNRIIPELAFLSKANYFKDNEKNKTFRTKLKRRMFQLLFKVGENDLG